MGLVERAGRAVDARLAARGWPPRRRRVLRHFSSLLYEQLVAMVPITLLQVLVLAIFFRKTTAEPALEAAGLISAVVGLVLFLDGLAASVMPMALLVGAELPQRLRLPLVMLVAFVLGVLVTYAEPAIAALRPLAALVDPAAAPYLYCVMNEYQEVLVLSIGLGVGAAAVIGLCKFMWAIPMRRLIFGALAPTIGLACYMNWGNPHLKPILGVAWDAGAVTTGPVTVPILLSLGVGTMQAKRQRDAARAVIEEAAGSGTGMALEGFGIVTLASLLPILAVELMAVGLGAAHSYEEMLARASAAAAAAARAVPPVTDTSPLKEVIFGVRAITPLSVALLLLVMVVLRLPLPTKSLIGGGGGADDDGAASRGGGGGSRRPTPGANDDDDGDGDASDAGGGGGGPGSSRAPSLGRASRGSFTAGGGGGDAALPLTCEDSAFASLSGGPGGATTKQAGNGSDGDQPRSSSNEADDDGDEEAGTAAAGGAGGGAAAALPPTRPAAPTLAQQAQLRAAEAAAAASGKGKQGKRRRGPRKPRPPPPVAAAAAIVSGEDVRDYCEAPLPGVPSSGGSFATTASGGVPPSSLGSPLASADIEAALMGADAAAAAAAGGGRWGRVRGWFRQNGRLLLGLLECQVGMCLFNIGLTYGFTAVGDMTGSTLPASFLAVPWEPGSPFYSFAGGVALTMATVFGIGVLATNAEPALNVLGQTVETLSNGRFGKRTLVWAVSVGVAVGMCAGAAKILFRLDLIYFILGKYAVACALTAATKTEAYTAVAWDSAGVTTGPVTVPFVLSLGIGFSKAVDAPEGFGILTVCSVAPIISVLLTSLLRKPVKRAAKELARVSKMSLARVSKLSMRGSDPQQPQEVVDFAAGVGLPADVQHTGGGGGGGIGGALARVSPGLASLARTSPGLGSLGRTSRGPRDAPAAAQAFLSTIVEAPPGLSVITSPTAGAAAAAAGAAAAGTPPPPPPAAK